MDTRAPEMMDHRTTTAVLALLVLICSGCQLCPSCDLDSYGAYGGRWQRTDRNEGTVASVFHPGGAKVPYATDAMPYGEDGLEENSDLDRDSGFERDSGLDVEQLDDEQLQDEMFDSLDEEPTAEDDSVLEPLDF